MFSLILLELLLEEEAVGNNAAKNMVVQIFLQDSAFILGGYIPRSKIAGSYGNYFLIF